MKKKFLFNTSPLDQFEKRDLSNRISDILIKLTFYLLIGIKIIFLIVLLLTYFKILLFDYGIINIIYTLIKEYEYFNFNYTKIYNLYSVFHSFEDYDYNTEMLNQIRSIEEGFIISYEEYYIDTNINIEFKIKEPMLMGPNSEAGDNIYNNSIEKNNNNNLNILEKRSTSSVEGSDYNPDKADHVSVTAPERNDDQTSEQMDDRISEQANATSEQGETYSNNPNKNINNIDGLDLNNVQVKELANRMEHYVEYIEEYTDKLEKLNPEEQHCVREDVIEKIKYLQYNTALLENLTDGTYDASSTEGEDNDENKDNNNRDNLVYYKGDSGTIVHNLDNNTWVIYIHNNDYTIENSNNNNFTAENPNNNNSTVENSTNKDSNNIDDNDKNVTYKDNIDK